MARIEDLVSSIPDPRLRAEVAAEVVKLKARLNFGLVFERHIPEYVRLPRLPVKAGSLVALRNAKESHQFEVMSIDGETATITRNAGASSRKQAIRDLIAIKRFGDPIYPALVSCDRIDKGGPEKPFHTIINGENYHALQLLLYTCAGKADVIYIDPPYNTGARDWKYNNFYVDGNDSWRHSKWLSFMEKRLLLAKKLLKPDGVLIVTIDEHEVIHLGMLIEQIMPEYLRYLVTIVMNPKGTFKANFGRVEEYAIFCCPNIEGADVIQGKPDESVEDGETEDRYLRRRGAESSFRKSRPNQFYALMVDVEQLRVLDVGPLVEKEDGDYPRKKKGDVTPCYPIDSDGKERTWCYNRATMKNYIAQGVIVVRRKKDGELVFWRQVPKTTTKRLKTVWWEKSHDAGTHGTALLTKMLGSARFPFPKSLYAVKDCLAAVVRNKPDSLIIDFFAGSGTTFHATCLLNAEDGGSRRCILVTNNEVEEKRSKALQATGIIPGDTEYEKHGIFMDVTMPRCKAAVLGERPDGTPLEDEYLNGSPMAEGFDENVEFLTLDYLDPDEVARNQQLNAIQPILWMMSGARGDIQQPAKRQRFFCPKGLPYAVLVDEAHFTEFREKIRSRNDMTHVFLVTDSEDAFQEMAAYFPTSVRVVMLFSDYLDNFKINIESSDL